MNVRAKLLLTLAGLACLTGCDSMKTVPVATEPDIVTVKLAQAADKAAEALHDIASIEQQRGPAAVVDDYTNAPSNLMQPVSIRWSGPIEAVTKVLADHAGMRFHVKGNIPPVPLTVNVDAYQQPILHVLRDIGLQAGHRADLSVDPRAGVIELRYAPGDDSTPLNVIEETPHASEIK
jgi:defect in organelle trafficking protein DotD